VIRSEGADVAAVEELECQRADAELPALNRDALGGAAEAAGVLARLPRKRDLVEI
jgi:hypothetical protein